MNRRKSASRRSNRANIRLARFLVVLSLTTVFGAGFAMQAGAGSTPATGKTQSVNFVTVTIASGESLWSVAKAFGSGDPRQLVDEILTINGLTSAQLPAGTKVRVPLD
ncbi:MAG: LysM peptidoglycan-binding domain-containing protein [Candidatus Nanopelagicaceae bacterium]